MHSTLIRSFQLIEIAISFEIPAFFTRFRHARHTLRAQQTVVAAAVAVVVVAVAVAVAVVVAAVVAVARSSSSSSSSSSISSSSSRTLSSAANQGQGRTDVALDFMTRYAPLGFVRATAGADMLPACFARTGGATLDYRPE